MFFKIWKTIKIGTELKTGKDFSKALEDKRVEIDDDALFALDNNRFQVQVNKTDVDLVRVTLSELGFDNEEDLLWSKNAYSIAKILGLDICPAEVGPHLRLQYMDQPKGEWLFIAMEPLLCSGEVFCMTHDEDGLWLTADHLESIDEAKNHAFIVFILPRRNETN